MKEAKRLAQSHTLVGDRVELEPIQSDSRAPAPDYGILGDKVLSCGSEWKNRSFDGHSFCYQLDNSSPGVLTGPGAVPCNSDRASKKTDSALASGGLSAAGE